MEMIRLIPTANAGAVLWLNGLCIWADVLNEENEGGYEVLSDAHFEKLLTDPSFRPDAILFTHRHADHYSETLLFRAVEAFPNALVYVGGAHSEGKVMEIRGARGSVTLRTIPLPHDGVRFKDVRNDALLLESPAGNVLIPGDCPIACPALLDTLRETPCGNAAEMPSEAQKKAVFLIRLALLNFPWLSLGKGRKALSVLDPGHVFFFHLPSPESDPYNYRAQAERMLSMYGGEHDWRIAGKPFEEESFRLS